MREINLPTALTSTLMKENNPFKSMDLKANNFYCYYFILVIILHSNKRKIVI